MNPLILTRKTFQALVLIFLLINTFSYSDVTNVTTQIHEYPMKLENIITFGSDKVNEDFYSPKRFTIGKDGDIYILDSGNSRIQCFSPYGVFKHSFGKFGQGPGELSKEASLIKILEDGNIYVVDNFQRRIVLYDINGKHINTLSTKSSYDDILLINKTYYLSNLILREKYSPIFRTDDLTNIKQSFGEIVEPTINIIKTVKNSPVAPILENEFTFMNMTSLFNDSNGNIFYSQLQPYNIIKYSNNGIKINEIHGEVEFDTHFPLEIKFINKSVNKRVTGPVPIVYSPIKRKDDKFIIPIISPDRSYFIFDLYDDECRHIKRYRLPNTIYDFKKSAGITNIVIDEKDILYCLIISREDNPIMSINKILFY